MVNIYQRQGVEYHPQYQLHQPAEWTMETGNHQERFPTSKRQGEINRFEHSANYGSNPSRNMKYLCHCFTFFVPFNRHEVGTSAPNGWAVIFGIARWGHGARCLPAQICTNKCTITSHLTHYRSFQGRFFRPDDQTKNVKALKETSWSSRSGLNPTRTTPPCYNNTTLGNLLYAQRKGPNVINPICLTCKNCSHKCAADCEHCVTQSSTQQFW